ncbi:MAG: tetratricopeptide repeat protein [Opitutales bacterium]
MSTWKGELDQFPGMREALVKAGILVVESDPPAHDGPHHTWRQQVSLYRGLLATPAGCQVLKARTDRNSPYLEWFLQDLAKPLGSAISWGPVKPLLQKRFRVVQTYSLIPLAFHDMVFMGDREDLLRLCHFGAQPEALSPDPALDPGYSWLRLLVGRVWSGLDRYFECLDAKRAARLMAHGLKAGPKAGPMPDLFHRLLALHLVFLSTHLEWVGDDPGLGADLTQARLFPAFLLGQNGLSRLPHDSRERPPRAVIRSRRLVDWAVAGTMDPNDTDEARFREALGALRANPAAWRAAPSRKDCEAVHEYIARVSWKWDLRWRDPPDWLADTRRNRSKTVRLQDHLPLLAGLGLPPADEAWVTGFISKRSRGGVSLAKTYLLLGRAYMTGAPGLRASRAEALRWFRAAAERKLPQANVELGRLLLNDVETTRPALEEAARRLLWAAERDHPEAACLLGTAMVEKRLREPSAGEGMRWLRRAAAKGSTEAQERLKDLPSR